ncbi:MAG: HAD family hydrolase [Desulfovibrionaceae bacterium]
MNIKAVIFDMDGVLIDAKEWHYEALNKALSLFGYEITRFEHISTYDGLSTRTKLSMLTQEKGLPSSLHEFINEMKQQYTVPIILSLCRPRFNHEYALSKLQLEGFKLAVASNSIRHTVELMMQYAQLTKYFEFMMSNQDVQKPKPDPEIYTKAIQQLGLLPSECLIVEDNKNGIKAATQAGAHVFVVRSVEDVTYSNIKEYIAQLE